MDRLELITSKEYWIEYLEVVKENKITNNEIAENIVNKLNEAIIYTRSS